MKKALMNASVASMIYKFNMGNMDILKELGYQVDVACNFGKENPISKKEIQQFRYTLKKREIAVYKIVCPRKIFSAKKIMISYKQIKKLADKGNYSLVHTQSPIGGVICRLAFRKARKKGTKVIYTAHGFHFYKGAPLINWLAYYPVEKICSYMTDVLICINKEDYELAKRKMKAKRVVYVPGVGIDLDRFQGSAYGSGGKEPGPENRSGEASITSAEEKRREYRKGIGVKPDEILLLSVGELNKNKNHIVVIKALAGLASQGQHIHYAIAGQGEMGEALAAAAKKLGVGSWVHLLGFQEDIAGWYRAADIFVFPSFREGLSVSLMEAMAFGMPCIVSRIRGNCDLIEEGRGGYLFEPGSICQLKSRICCLLKKTMVKWAFITKRRYMNIKKKM